MTQAYEKPVFEIEQIVLVELPVEQKQTPFIKKESGRIERKRLLKRWKNSEGYYYLNPEKFRFSLKNL